MLHWVSGIEVNRSLQFGCQMNLENKNAKTT